MRWQNVETPTFAGSAGSAGEPAVVETMQLIDRDGNEVAAFTKAVDGTIASTVDGQPKVYRALLTQTGTDAPVATVLENTLGEVPIFYAVDTGLMTCSVLGELFVANKTFVSIEGIRFGSISPEDAIFASVILAGPTQLEISTAVCSNGGGGLWGVPVATDGVLSNHGIEILVCP